MLFSKANAQCRTRGAGALEVTRRAGIGMNVEKTGLGTRE